MNTLLIIIVCFLLVILLNMPAVRGILFILFYCYQELTKPKTEDKE